MLGEESLEWRGRDAVTDQRARDLADLADSILAIARTISERGFRDHRIVPLSPLEVLTLRHIRRNPGITPTRIGADLAVKSSNTSVALRELEKKNFIRREPDPNDRRSTRIYATAEALDSVRRVRAEMQVLFADLALDDETLHACATAFGAFESSMFGRPAAV